ncbi:MAG: HAMP domain-containing histidine kinase [Lachnospiraceae bacterium]|nr:HAMP domain-containing histidine kinase [Lachnospiraceae bacterium]
MDWLMAGTAIFAGGTAAVSMWRVRRLKQEVYRFTEQVEQGLDHIISGEGFPENEESGKDSLWGRCSEKLWRICHIWTKREEADAREKLLMKELISDISHQTRTPIANMRLYLEFLQEEEVSEKGREFLSLLEGQTRKLEFLLGSMVKMSRLEAGIIHIRQEQTGLFDTIAGAAGEIVPAASNRQIALTVDCSEDLQVKHDRKWTEEAVFNVLDNAVKYTEPGGSIHVVVRRQEVFTRISIRDTGKGIARERQAEIFSRFYREPEVHDGEGAGIGLYLSRKILELQGGYIEVRSEAGEGAEFSLYLPNGTA